MVKVLFQRNGDTTQVMQLACCNTIANQHISVRSINFRKVYWLRTRKDT